MNPRVYNSLNEFQCLMYRLRLNRRLTISLRLCGPENVWGLKLKTEIVLKRQILSQRNRRVPNDTLSLWY